MKSKLFIGSLLLTLTLATANLAFAQVYEAAYSFDQYGPATFAGWSSSAPLCVLLPGSAASTVDYANGVVSFTKSSSGTIGLDCTVGNIGNGLAPSDIGTASLTFSNNGGAANGCTVEFFYTDRTLGDPVGWTSGNQSFNGTWTVNIGIGVIPNHAYDVDVYLYRPKGAVGKCTPTAFAAYLAAAPIQ
jgi:hypothetical protein